MREYISLIEDTLLEAQTIEVNTRSDKFSLPARDGVRLYVSPTRKQVMNVIALSAKKASDDLPVRGVLLRTGEVFIWNAFVAHHTQVLNALEEQYGYNIKDAYCFYLSNEKGKVIVDGLYKDEDKEAVSSHRIISNWLREPEAVTEAKLYQLDICNADMSYKKVKVYENTTKTETIILIKKYEEYYGPSDYPMRGFTLPNGNVYIWSAYGCYHHAVSLGMTEIGFDTTGHSDFYISTERNQIGLHVSYPNSREEILRNPIISKWCTDWLGTSQEEDENILAENKILKLSIHPLARADKKKIIKVYVNPSYKIAVDLVKKSQQDGRIPIRGILLKNNIFVWDASEASHQSVLKTLNNDEGYDIGGSICFYIFNIYNFDLSRGSQVEMYAEAADNLLDQTVLDANENVQRAIRPLVRNHEHNLTEGQFRVDTMAKSEHKGFKGLIVTTNPSKRQLIGLIELSHNNALRGLVWKDTVFVWDARNAEHSQVVEALRTQQGYDIHFDNWRDQAEHSFYALFIGGTKTITIPQANSLTSFRPVANNPHIQKWLEDTKQFSEMRNIIDLIK